MMIDYRINTIKYYSREFNWAQFSVDVIVEKYTHCVSKCILQSSFLWSRQFVYDHKHCSVNIVLSKLCLKAYHRPCILILFSLCEQQYSVQLVPLFRSKVLQNKFGLELYLPFHPLIISIFFMWLTKITHIYTYNEVTSLRPMSS